MMFVDQARIYVKGGDGGNGIVSWRREKFVPLGGPAGGDGGRGGDVIFVVDEGLRTLIDFKYQRHFKADRGEHGRTKNRHGADAENLVVRIPPGTVVWAEDKQEWLGDLVASGQQLVVAKGGRGGRGNAHFASRHNKAPEIAEKGEPAVEKWLTLELKVLADVGLVGFPSVGKSTLLSVVSAARPKIGDYPFTTLTPELGVVSVGERRSFVLADLPGLIEGAHTGHGLGHEFLRHVERTRVLVHVIDMAASEGRDPLQDYDVIRRELEAYQPGLTQRPTLVAANKMDLPMAAENLITFRQAHPELPVYPISGVSHSGLNDLLFAVADALDHQVPSATPLSCGQHVEPKANHYRLRQSSPEFTIHRSGGHFIVESADLEKLVKMTNFELYDAVERFQRILRNQGVDQALKDRGAAQGDLILVGDMEFEFVD